MGTVVTMDVVTAGVADHLRPQLDESLSCAFGWFDLVESHCSRFDPDSELMRLCARAGVPVPVSPLLYEAAAYALAVAEASGGAFDPTVGAAMQARGFDREYRTGRRVPGLREPATHVSYRDVELDPATSSITLRRPLVLDLGAIAKGLAIDLAARELQRWRDYVIDAGGDLYLAGVNARGESWTVGIRHPREADALVDAVRVSDAAVCTSGDYERRIAGTDVHHLIDPRTDEAACSAASATVVAPAAIVADALATAAFVLGPEAGLALLTAQGVEGMIVTPALERRATSAFPVAETR
jgi:thiamine biosynthesis lipoprotein